MPKVRKILIVLGFIMLCSGTTAGGLYDYITSGNYPYIVKPLPDVFTFQNGSRVETAADWSIRREEIKSLLLEIEYGTMPGRPDSILVTKKSSEMISPTVLATIYQFTIIPSNMTPSNRFNFTVWIYSPLRNTSLPVFLNVAKDGAGSQDRVADLVPTLGYVYVCLNSTELDPDTEGYDITGPCQQAYPGYSWGCLGVWAWGTMRVVDYLVREPWVISADGFQNIDPAKIISTGHSRRGKTAMLAAAYDERIAMTIPSGSGCGGAGSFLVLNPTCETLGIITSEKTYKAWFKSDFGRYGGNLKELPFDQHFLRALIAPRIILSKDGFLDIWANPSGTQAIKDASQPIFDLLNASDHNGLYFREGGHSYTRIDTENVLSFADYHFFNRTEGVNLQQFYMHPFDFDLPKTN